MVLTFKILFGTIEGIREEERMEDHAGDSNMKILIFGASGATGHELVRQALAQGHDVTAFVRNRAKLAVSHKRLTSLEGNIEDFAAVEHATGGHDASFIFRLLAWQTAAATRGS